MAIIIPKKVSVRVPISSTEYDFRVYEIAKNDVAEIDIDSNRVRIFYKDRNFIEYYKLEMIVDYISLSSNELTELRESAWGNEN